MDQKLLGNHPYGLVFVVSAPAGTGKTTLVKMLTDEFAFVTRSISFTTREPRKGEVDGKDYFFISHEEFNAKIESNEFLEYAEVYGHFYGTSKNYVQNECKQGNHVVLVIDTQGALEVQKKMPAIFIFIKPPRLDDLADRLKKRNTESEELMKTRLSWAKKEMSLESHYDYQIVNQDLQIAYQVLRSIVIAEEHRIKKNQ